MTGCDKCSMCCKLLQIDEPILKKPLNQWCQHCTKPGCGIYNERPEACQIYACVYLQSQTDKNPLPLRLRPDRCKVIIDITPDEVFAICRVDPQYPRAIDDPEIKTVIAVLSTLHSIIVATGKKKQLLHVNEKGRKQLREMGIADDQTIWHD
jgi:hypothetical protein